MNEKKQSFIKEIFRKGIFSNLISAIVMFFFSSFFALLRAEQLPWAFLVFAVFVLSAEFLFAPLSNKIITKKLSDKIEKWESGSMYSIDERTSLLKDVMKYPMIKGIETFIYYIMCTLVCCLSYRIMPSINTSWAATGMVAAACIFGSYYSTLLAINYSEAVCNAYGVRLVRQGINKALIDEMKNLGISMNHRMIMYTVIPSFFVSLLIVLITIQGYKQVLSVSISDKLQIARLITIAVMSIILAVTLFWLYYRQISKSYSALRESLTNVLDSNVANPQMDTNISDEMQYNIVLLNETVSRFNTLIDKAKKISRNVLKSTEDLSIIARELSSTSLEQSSDVKEILATMEDSNALAQNISGKISKVSHGTDNTLSDVNTGFQLLQESISQMEHISKSNAIITEGIKTLGKQIDDIGDVVTIINDIADQTRIIAFNAELEAVSAGDEGRNFHIVATEIRRLANSTTNSVHEIQKYIETIQNASQKLIESSVHSTDLIQQGSEMTNELENHFSGIKESAEITSSKTSDISNIIEQQTSSFNQIVITLRQISAGIESFTSSTGIISNTANDMQTVASRLEKLQDEN